MINLFQLGNFKSHSGEILPWKIDCDMLTEKDWECLAWMIVERVRSFGKVEGIPTGGWELAHDLEQHITPDCSRLLIVDDVLTTGKSMEEYRHTGDDIGAVVFARGPCPYWVTPLFQMEG